MTKQTTIVVIGNLRVKTMAMYTGQRFTHYENTPIQIYRKFPLQKLKNIQIKKTDIFLISAQNIDCGYSLEPPQ